MAAGATHGLGFRIPGRRAGAQLRRRDRAFETWRASIWTAGALATVTLATTALNVVPGPADEIVMAASASLTGVLGHLAPLPE